MILKLLNKILILFEIFCKNKDIHSMQKNSYSTLATSFFRNEKYLQVEKYFLVQAKCFRDTIKTLKFGKIDLKKGKILYVLKLFRQNKIIFFLGNLFPIA